MLARQLHSPLDPWRDRTQGVIVLTTQACNPRRHEPTAPAYLGRNRACCTCRGSRARAGLNESQVLTAEADSHTSRRAAGPDPLSSPLAEQARPPVQLEGSGAVNGSVSPQPVSAALWRTSVANPPPAGGGGSGGCTAAATAAATAGGRATVPEPGNLSCNVSPPSTSGRRGQQTGRPRDGKPSKSAPREAQPGSPLLPLEEANDGSTGTPTFLRDDAVLGTVRNPGAAFQFQPQPQASWFYAAGGGVSDPVSDATADGFGMSPSLNVASASISTLDSLVAGALAFDERAFQGAAWADADWEPSDADLIRSFDATAAATAATKSTSSGIISISGSSRTTVGGWPGGERSRSRGSNHLFDDDDDDTWEFGAYAYDGEYGNDSCMAAAARGAATRAYRDADSVVITQARPFPKGAPRSSRRGADDSGGGGGGDVFTNEAGSPGDFQPPRRRRGRDRRGRVNGRQWQDDWAAWEDAEEVGPLARAWMRIGEPGGSLDAAKWDNARGDFIDVDRDFGEDRGAFGGVGRGGGTGGGGLRGSGKRVAIKSESELRRAVAAVSTRLPRIGLSVTFSLPPARGAATATPSTAAAEPLTATQQTGAAAVAAVGTPTTTTADAAPSSKAASGGAHDWATVPLSYNFGPSFKLLEDNAATREVPFPEELLLLAGRLPDCSGGSGGGGTSGKGGGRSAVDALLPGCTAYMIAADYHVLLVQDGRSVSPAVTWLRASLGEDLVVGIDAEWPPQVKKGPGKLAMLQLASPSRVLLLHIAQMRRQVLAPGGPIYTLLSDTSLTWVGAGWSNADSVVMAAAFGGAALPPVVVDVQAAARAGGWPRVGLLGLVRDLMGVREFQKPRSVTICNWAAATVSEQQVRYAALDALLPPILLRQLRLFAALPALRCCFCKQALHAPWQHDAQPPLEKPSYTPAASAPSLVCEHCGRTVRPSSDQPVVTAVGSTDEADADAATGCAVSTMAAAGAVGSTARAADPQVSAATHSASRPASKASSLRSYLQSVVEGKQEQHLSGRPLRRHQRLLFLPDPNPGPDLGPGSGVDSGPGLKLGSGSESGSVSGRGAGRNLDKEQPPLHPAARAAAAKGKGKKKCAAMGASSSSLCSSSSSSSSPLSPSIGSRKKALWDAFAEASPSATPAVGLAMSGQEGSNGCVHSLLREHFAHGSN